jgi:pimeloyl-ACP methyl ester carboxylesterase
VTVPENRADPDGATVDLFVARILPPPSTPAPDPIVSLWGELGEELDYAGLAPVVARVNRELIVIEQRGTGHSRPMLACPEVEDAEWELYGIPMTSPRWRTTFLSAAGECYDRLVGQGVDLSAYNLAEMAADVEDVRRALGIDELNLTAIGDGARIALEIVRRYPDHLRAVVLDSPEFPEDGGFATAAEATQQALALTEVACEARPACAESFPDIVEVLDEAVARLAERPIRLRLTKPDGQPLPAVIDGGSLVRMVRWYMGRSPGGPMLPSVPAVIHDAAIGRFPSGFDLETSHPTCLGYFVFCERDAWNHALAFSELCHDELPFAEPAATGPGFDEAFARSPYRALCRVWKIPPGMPPAPVRSDVPTLVLLGEMNPYVSDTAVERSMTGLRNGFLVEVPGLGTGNLLAFACPREIRDAWIERPSQPPDTSCLAEQPLAEFVAPVPHTGLSGSPIPEGVFRAETTLADTQEADTLPSFAMVSELELDDGRFRWHTVDSPRRDDFVGVYGGAGDEVTFVVDEPYAYAGLSWTVRWRPGPRGLSFSGTEMRSREDALFFGAPEYLTVLALLMESDRWRPTPARDRGADGPVG